MVRESRKDRRNSRRPPQSAKWKKRGAGEVWAKERGWMYACMVHSGASGSEGCVPWQDVERRPRREDMWKKRRCRGQGR